MYFTRLCRMLSSLVDFPGILFSRFSLREVKVMKETVFITGCDSGIGNCFARTLASLGCIVFAGVYDENSEGTRTLKDFKSKGEIIIIQVDVRDFTQILKCAKLLENNITGRKLELSAVINNAGVMVFGEFEWQTEELINQQINVNLAGYMRVAKAFCPLLRQYKGRLLNVSSHCASVSLPCLSVYSATKAAVEAWSSALALEMYKFDVPVITIHPGSYVTQSGILKNQRKYADEMWQSMSKEQQDAFQHYFEPMMNYMSGVSTPACIDDPSLTSILQSAIFSKIPKHTYVNSPWRYYFYYGLISWARPFWKLRRKLILSFISIPKYK